jgi:hypothetical protein
MRLVLAAAVVSGLFIAGCITDNEPSSAGTFHLKFINTGSYPITALFLKPLSDTADWGASLLPVARLDSLQYFWMNDLGKGPVYAFKAMFDSAGTPLQLTFAEVYTNGPDTISAYSGMGPAGFGNGYNWGYQTWTGEQNVVP